MPLRVPSPAGPALGLFAEAAYAMGECSLAEGDVILLFTDGLYEVTSPDGEEEYGQPRLLAAARKQHAPARTGSVRRPHRRCAGIHR